MILTYGLIVTFLIAHNIYERDRSAKYHAALIESISPKSAASAPLTAPANSSSAPLTSSPTSMQSIDEISIPRVTRNLSAIVQTALYSSHAEVKSKAVEEIHFCREYENREQMVRNAQLPPEIPRITLIQKMERYRADCQTLSPNELAFAKDLATGAYRLGAKEGAYLYAREVGIPEDPVERKVWLDALKAAAYAGSGLSQSFVGKEVGEMFEDREEAFGFRMVALRATNEFDQHADGDLYRIVSGGVSDGPKPVSGLRAEAVMRRLMEAQAKRRGDLSTGER